MKSKQAVKFIHTCTLTLVTCSKRVSRLPVEVSLQYINIFISMQSEKVVTSGDAVTKKYPIQLPCPK